MGGPGSGGRRGGAGRKKKPTHLRGIDGGAGRRGPADPPGAEGELPPSAPVADAALLEPPAALRAAAGDVWLEWAPLALAAGTLVASVAANFAQLCMLEADRRELWARYQMQLDVHGEPRPLLRMSAKEEMATRREHRTLAKDIHARMKDFMIAPFGKELATPDAGAGEVDPLDAFTRRRG